MSLRACSAFALLGSPTGFETLLQFFAAQDFVRHPIILPQKRSTIPASAQDPLHRVASDPNLTFGVVGCAAAGSSAAGIFSSGTFSSGTFSSREDDRNSMVSVRLPEAPPDEGGCRSVAAAGVMSSGTGGLSTRIEDPPPVPHRRAHC